MGISNNNNLNSVDYILDDSYDAYISCFAGKNIVFSTQNRALFTLDTKLAISEDTIHLARSIFKCFFQYSKYLINSSSKSNYNYHSNFHRDYNYRLAIQHGICTWILGDNSTKLEMLFSCLEKWSVQTYEGKNVTLGFIINPNATSTFDPKYGTWLDFMNDDFVAVLTDCVDSVIELDKECNFSKYLSTVNVANIEQGKIGHGAPIRFAKLIENFVVGEAVGIFLLNNGDLIIAKKQKIVLVKRNLKWLNFSYEAFNNALSLNADLNLESNFKENIYASMLDVSFAHTGGIISIITDACVDTITDYNSEDAIVSCSDNLCNLEDYETLKKLLRKIQPEISETDISRRLLKRQVISNLIGKEKFIEINRKLRSELISLDGACIIQENGTVLSFGAIIKNDSGSSGGGRGAAARKLSNYGFAIKISTDGYIELYMDGSLKYSIK